MEFVKDRMARLQDAIDKKEVIHGGCFPNEDQELLLKTAFSKADKCIDSWRKWKSRADIDNLDYGSFRLLPLVYQRLTSQGVEDPLLMRLKSVYRYILAKNHQMFFKVIPILKALHENKIDTMLLKGTALTIRNYRSFALRPQMDIDILVKANDASNVFNFMLDQRWAPQYDHPQKRILRLRHSCCFDGGKEKRLDLHWRLLPQYSLKKDEDVFWLRSIPIEYNGVKTRVLSDTDQLFHTFAHGLKWSSLSSCRWAADAMCILNTKTDNINWDELYETSLASGLIIPVREGMGYLQKTFDNPIPDKVIRKFRIAPSTAFERMDFRVMTRGKIRFFGDFFKFTFSYLRMHHPEGILSKLCFYPVYLQFCWNIKNLWLMPLLLIHQIKKKRVT